MKKRTQLINRKTGIIALVCYATACCSLVCAQHATPARPHILISTDIGGTDPDDNQSMTHLLMYSNRFQIEGLVSSPSYGNGSKKEILRMIDLYEQDRPLLAKQQSNFPTPDYLRSVTKQGMHGNVGYKGYSKPTEGSDWIVKCARRHHKQTLWILCWGGLEDLAQALHDAPDIVSYIKVYWIGGPNKKWSANSYAYIASHFPHLWFIEVNASYYGLFLPDTKPDILNRTSYYQSVIKSKSHLAKDFAAYYKGEVKMGDSPSLLYMMDGDPEKPSRESWGGSFVRIDHSPRIILSKPGNNDSVAFCSIVEFRIQGPVRPIPPDSVCWHMEVAGGKTTQSWPGFYLGKGIYALRYIPKKAEKVVYRFQSAIPEIDGLGGTLYVSNLWPGKYHHTDYLLGKNWYSDRPDKDDYFGTVQGGMTVNKWRNDIFTDWATRWKWLNNDDK